MGGTSVDELRGQVADGSVMTVVAIAPGNYGQPLGRAYPAEVFLRRFVDGPGSGFPGVYFAFDLTDQPVLALEEAAQFSRGLPDIWSRADLTTVRPCPWLPSAVICVLDVFSDADSEQACPWAPRSMLRDQVEALHRHGYVLECASEIEFVVFRRPDHDSDRSTPLVPAAVDHGCYRLGPLAELWSVIEEIVETTSAAGIEVESVGAEASPRQIELNLRHCDPVEMADRHMLYKFGVREIARRHGLIATFMARPTDSYGSSCHFHASIWNAADRTPADDRTFDAFVAGQLDLALDFLPLMAPNPNSYRRFGPHLGAPTRIVAGPENRTAAVRVVHDHSGARVENRLPGADVNPYLGLTALLAQARWGIERGLDQPDTSDSYVSADADYPAVPSDLVTAIENFTSSIPARELLGDSAHNHVVGIVEHEQRSAESENPDAELAWEIERYLDRT